MNIRRFNWALWAGLLLTVIGFLSYFLVFVWFPVTRDFPWANLLLFGTAAGFLVVGIRRAFAGDRLTRSKVAGVIVTTLSVLIIAAFIFSAFIMARWMPAAKGAPQVGQKAPAFSLQDINSQTVALSDLISRPIKGKTATVSPKGVLLIFYRGYW